RMEILRKRMSEVTNELLNARASDGEMDAIADFAEPLPCIITAEMLGLPVQDARLLKNWSEDFAELLGNFEHDRENAIRIRRSLGEVADYFRNAIEGLLQRPNDGLISAFLRAEIEGQRFSEDEVLANAVITMVGALETTTNLIGNGILTLL